MSLKVFLFFFRGRINRQSSWYWIFTLCASLIWLVLTLLLGIDLLHRGRDAKAIIPVLVLLWLSLAVQAKRWHDRDKSAWWLLINIVPIVGPLWSLVKNGFWAGTLGENRYDEDPLGRDDSDSLTLEVQMKRYASKILWNSEARLILKKWSMLFFGLKGFFHRPPKVIFQKFFRWNNIFRSFGICSELLIMKLSIEKSVDMEPV